MHCSVAMRKRRRYTVQEERLSENENLPLGEKREEPHPMAAQQLNLATCLVSRNFKS